MDRRTFVKGSAVIAGVAGLPRVSFGQAAPLKIGVVGPKTGPLAGGAAITHFPGFKMWATEVNARGGLKLKAGQRKVELIEYDDRSQPPEVIKAVERLATVDKVDFIMPPYSTGANLAAAPIFNKIGYPQITQAAVTDQGPELVKRYPNLFIVQGRTSGYARAVADLLKKLKDEGKVGKRVAMVNVADAFGIELANAARPIFKEAGFDIVYDKSYPLGTQDLAPVIKAAKAENPDAFVAWSYPPDTFALAEQAKIEGLNVKFYYSAVATGFQSFGAKFGASAENILGAGGIQDSPEIRDFYKRHKEITGVDADYWGSPFYHSLLQIITQTVEAVGSMDKPAMIAHLKNNKFKTIVGELDIRSQMLDKYYTIGQWQGGFFHAVAGVGFSGYKPVVMKAGW